MRAIVASNEKSSGTRLIEALKLHEVGAEIALCSLDDVVERLVHFRPDVVLVQFPAQPEDAISLIHDIKDTYPTRTIIVGPAIEAKMILRILREGAFHYIDQDELADELKAALARFRSEPSLHADLGRMITVVGAGGGTGATTLAVNVSAGLTHGEPRCALLDLKLESGDASTLLDLQPDHTLADFCRNAQRMDKTMFAQCLTAHKCGIQLLAAPGSFRDVSQVTSRGIRKAMTMARCLFPYVVADVDGALRYEAKQALLQSDIVLLTMRLDFTSVRQAQRLLDYFQDLQIGKDRVRLIVNRLRPRELKAKDVEKKLGMRVFHFVPDDARRVNLSNNRGIPVVLDFPTSSISRNLLKIASSVNGHVSSNGSGGGP